MTDATTRPAPASGSDSPELLEARRARRGRLQKLSERLHLVLALGPGPGAVALYGLHWALAPCWQFATLFALSLALWACFALSFVAARRDRPVLAVDLVFYSVWLFCAAAVTLRQGAMPTTILAYVGDLVLAWLLAPRRMLLAGALVLVTLLALRVLDHAGVLPAAAPPRSLALALDLALLGTVVPVLAFGLHLGLQANRLPFEHLRRSSESQGRLLELLTRVQPDLRSMAESASRGATELAASAQQQAASTQVVAAAMASLGHHIARAADTADRARAVAEEARVGSAATSERIEAVERQLQRFLQDLSTIVEGVEALSVRSVGTEQVIESVEDVHAAVKVLALNAALEAARAGDAGKGLSVVASEMRTMIASTEGGVDEGRRLLAAIRADAAAAIARTQDGMKRLRTHLAELAEARDRVRATVESISEASRGAAEIAAGGEQQRAQVERVAIALRDLNVSTAGLTGLASDLAASVQQFAAGQAAMAQLVEASPEPPPAADARHAAAAPPPAARPA
jgi:methyl-accepting chemotaxis protein